MLSAKTYAVSEKFKSVQGEGVYAGTQMAFIRFAGCSVGKTVCHNCDTDFEEMHSFRGGGKFFVNELVEWCRGYNHVCLTGGEPLNQDLEALVVGFGEQKPMFHIETSGTILLPKWIPSHSTLDRLRYWVTVSPKPGWTKQTIRECDEIKVIVPGLADDGTTSGAWPSLNDAKLWAHDKPVFLQPRNGKFDIDKANLKFCIDACNENPELRLSVQMHKILGVQ
jgi:7-carboxy-7-deazaguanine synthase